MSFLRTRKLSVNKRINKNKKKITRIESKCDKMIEKRDDWDDSITELSSLRSTPEQMRRRHLIHRSHHNISIKSSSIDNQFNQTNNERKNINRMKRSESNPNISLNSNEINSKSVNHKISVIESMHELYNKLSNNKSIDENQTRPHFLAMIVKSLEDINQKVDELKKELRKEKSLRLQLENKVNNQEIIIEELIEDLLRVDPFLRYNAIKSCSEV